MDRAFEMRVWISPDALPVRVRRPQLLHTCMVFGDKDRPHPAIEHFPCPDQIEIGCDCGDASLDVARGAKDRSLIELKGLGEKSLHAVKAGGSGAARLESRFWVCSSFGLIVFSYRIISAAGCCA